MKVSIIGSGNVGGTLAQRIMEADLSDVVLLDIISGISEAKSLDLADARAIMGYSAQSEATADYKKIVDSDIIVVTAGIPRQPGMSREDLLRKNAQTVKEVITQIVRYAPDSIIIMVTNPLDALTYVALKTSGFNPKRVIGMGGILDSARFAHLVAVALGVSENCVQALVIGAHGETMIPLPRYCSVSGVNLTELLDDKKLTEITAQTIKRGAQIVSLLGKGSAFYAPSAAIFSMVKTILKGEKRVIPASVYADGQYGLKDVCIGLPVVLTKDGVERIIELKLTSGEQEKLLSSAKSIRKSVTNLFD